MTTPLLRLADAMRKAQRWEGDPLQMDVLRDPTRNQVLAAGRRRGKSVVGGQKLVPFAFSAFADRAWLEEQGKRREYWIVGPEYSDGEKEFRVLYNALRKLGVDWDKPGTYNNPHTGDMHISLWDGLFMVNVASAKYPDSLVGEGLSGVVLSEAAKLKPMTWPKYIRPMLSDFDGWSFMSSTPEGRNWFYRVWQSGQDPLRTDWRSWRDPAWNNPHVYKHMKVQGDAAEVAIRTVQALKRRNIIPEQLSAFGGLSRFISDEAWEGIASRTWDHVGEMLGVDRELLALMLDLSEEVFNQEIAAHFNEFVGRVFKEFDEEIHVGDFDYNPDWATYAALDYGFTNPFVWLLIQVDPFGTNIRIISEYYERGRTTEEAGEEILARGLVPGGLLGMFPDPAEPDRSAQLAGMLKVRSFGGTGGPISDRLEWIRRKLKPAEVIAHLPKEHDEWVPQLQIHRRCKETIREFNVYRYPRSAEEMEDRDKEAPEQPLKKDDHTPEALGRFMVGMFGSPWAEKAGPVRIARARLGRVRRR